MIMAHSCHLGRGEPVQLQKAHLKEETAMLVLHPEIAALWRHYKQVEENYYHKALGYSGEAAWVQSFDEKERAHRLSWAYHMASWEAGKIALALEDLSFPDKRNPLRGRKHPMSRAAYKHIEKIFARPDVQAWLRQMSRKYTLEHGTCVIHTMVGDYHLTTEDLEDGQRTLSLALDLSLDEVRMREKQLREEIPLAPNQRYPHLLQLHVYTVVREHKEVYDW
jgi:hypothetical protein